MIYFSKTFYHTFNCLFSGVENAWQHGVQGTFSWKKWSRDVAVSTVIGGLTVGITVATSWATTSSLLLQLDAKLLGVEYLEYVARYGNNGYGVFMGGIQN